MKQPRRHFLMNTAALAATAALPIGARAQGAPAVKIDGRLIISPAEKAYTVVALAPGPHEVEVNWAWDTGWPDLKFTIDVEAAKPLYLKISGSFENRGSTYLAGSSTQRVPQAIAEEVKGQGSNHN